MRKGYKRLIKLAIGKSFCYEFETYSKLINYRIEINNKRNNYPKRGLNYWSPRPTHSKKIANL